MISRRSIPVNVIRSLKIGEKATIYNHGDGCYPHGTFALHARDDGDDTIAESHSAKRLADWAFENGASEVRHEYDLKLSDDEP